MAIIQPSISSAFTAIGAAVGATSLDKDELDQLAIDSLCAYLRIKTVQPNPDYPSAVAFLAQMAKQLSLQFQCIELVGGKPIVILTLEGSDPSLPTIVLNSHMDVVPVTKEEWMCDPFGGLILPNGEIMGRGTQDMKGVGMVHLEAVRRITTAQQRLDRTIHLLFVPDEEIGSADGMCLFVQSSQFKQLNVGVVFDEGLSSSDSSISIFTLEKTPYWIRATAKGNPGHGSTLPDDCAVERLLTFCSRVQDFRKEQQRLIKTTKGARLGDVCSVNINALEAGSQINIIPAEASCEIDIRLPPTLSLENAKALFRSFAKQSQVEIEELLAESFDSSIDPECMKLWHAQINLVFERLSIETSVQVFPGATDSRFLRRIGIPCFGITPFRHTKPALHENNESINTKVYCEGIGIFESLLASLGMARPPDSL